MYICICICIPIFGRLGVCLFVLIVTLDYQELEDIMSKDPVKQAMTANLAAMLRPPSEVEREKAKAKAAKAKLIVKACQDAAKQGTLRTATDAALVAHERMTELGLKPSDPLYQTITAGMKRGVDAAASGVEVTVAQP